MTWSNYYTAPATTLWHGRKPISANACFFQIMRLLDPKQTILLTEANGVADTPLGFSEQNAVISGGNFHTEPVALASENKSLAHPASVDSLPTSANQEDHVSMATFAARRLLPLAENAATIIGIELLATCQGIDFLGPLKTSVVLEQAHGLVRTHIPFYKEDRYFAPDIIKIKYWVQSGQIRDQANLTVR